MGTSSCKVFRHRGYFFLWRSNCNGMPQHLGREMLEMVPKDRQALETWAQSLRDKMDNILAAYLKEFGEVVNGDKEMDLDDWSVGVSDCYQSYDANWSAYTYEINLDHMLFHVQLHPVFRLDNMPPLDVFIKAHNAATEYYCNSAEYKETHNMYNAHHGVFLHLIPEEYRLDISSLGAPTIKDEQLETYDRHIVNTVTVPEDVLFLNKSLSRAEAVTMRLLGTYVNLYATHRKDIILEEFGLAASAEDVGWNGREIACALAAVALLPFHTLDIGASSFKGAQYEFWFLRKHICFSLATHLHDDRNVRFHISRVVEHIISSPTTPDVVFGVVFSLFHCVVFRVDKAAGGTFTRTEVLDFLTAPQNPAIKGPPDNWLTPGMRVLVRLGHCEAADDIDFFHRNLSSEWWVCPDTYYTSKDCSESEASQTDGDVSHPRPVLPFELLSMIVNEIDEGGTLYSFALASRLSMAAAMPRLRLPQIRGENFKRDSRYYKPGYKNWGYGHILESFNDKIFPFVFDVEFDYYTASLAITTKPAAPYIFRTKNAIRMPRDSFKWSDTSGQNATFSRFYHFFDYESVPRDTRDWQRRYKEPHISFGYVTELSEESRARMDEEDMSDARARDKKALAETGDKGQDEKDGGKEGEGSGGKRKKTEAETETETESRETEKKAKKRVAKKRKVAKDIAKGETRKREKKSVPSSTRVLRSNAKVAGELK